MKEIPFNINYHVKVKLTDLGRHLHKKQKEDFYRDFLPHIDYTYTPPPEDEEGYSEWQMWVLMSDFGWAMQLGAEAPFEMGIILIVEEN